MGVINKLARLKALDRQKLLWSLHCMECVNKSEKSNAKWCTGCLIYEEFQQIGKVLNQTVKERKEVS